MESTTFEHTFIIGREKLLEKEQTTLLIDKSTSYIQCGSIPCHSFNLVQTLITPITHQSSNIKLLDNDFKSQTINISL